MTEHSRVLNFMPILQFIQLHTDFHNDSGIPESLILSIH